jgi:hypothetical protein
MNDSGGMSFCQGIGNLCGVCDGFGVCQGTFMQQFRQTAPLDIFHGNKGHTVM